MFTLTCSYLCTFLGLTFTLTQHHTFVLTVKHLYMNKHYELSFYLWDIRKDIRCWFTYITKWISPNDISMLCTANTNKEPKFYIIYKPRCIYVSTRILVYGKRGFSSYNIGLIKTYSLFLRQKRNQIKNGCK